MLLSELTVQQMNNKVHFNINCCDALVGCGIKRMFGVINRVDIDNLATVERPEF